jgi:hypothetical protein
MCFLFTLTLSYEGELNEDPRSAKEFRPGCVLLYAWQVISRAFKMAAVLDACLKGTVLSSVG